MNTKKNRCAWAGEDPIYIHYHDHEWGVPLHDDIALFELLNLEGAQAGLSWITVLKKRSEYKRLFCNFDPEKIARFTEKKQLSLLNEPGIIRNRLKIASVIQNAKSYLALRDSGVSFSDLIWDFVNHKPLCHAFKSLSDIPAKNDISDKLSKTLKQLGFKFVGSTICYAFMQASGMINDHLVSCFRHVECKKMAAPQRHHRVKD